MAEESMMVWKAEGRVAVAKEEGWAVVVRGVEGGGGDGGGE